MSELFSTILARAKAGDPAAREALLSQNLAHVRTFVRLKSGPRIRAFESASDLVQSVCREALENIDDAQCTDAVTFRSWLLGIAYHKILHRAEHLTAAKRDPARAVPLDAEGLLGCYATVATPSRHAASKEALAQLERAIDALPEADRDVLLESRLLGRSHKDIAERLGKTEVAVRKMLSRARARLGLILARGDSADIG